MKKHFLFYCLAALLFISCKSEIKEVSYLMESPPVGSTFENQWVSVKFVSSSLLSISSKTIHGATASAPYSFKDGKIKVLNPDNITAASIILKINDLEDMEKMTGIYCFSFSGEFISPDKLEIDSGCDYLVIGKNESEQHCGSPSLERVNSLK